MGACDVTATAKPGKSGNDWGFYYYKQDYNDALNAAQSWDRTDASQVTHSWKLPSEEQWQALINSCYWEWTDSYNYPTSPYNGKPGYIVYQVKSDADKNQFNISNSGYTPATVNHLFLPAAGFYYDGLHSVVCQGDLGYYWSTGRERYLYFDGGERYMNGYFTPNYGMSVRPVSE